MSKVMKVDAMTRRQLKAAKYKRFKGNKTEGQGFADVRKKHAESKYRKMIAREKRNLSAWTDKLQKIYTEAENESDSDTGHLEYLENIRKNKQKQQEQVIECSAKDSDVCRNGKTRDTAASSGSGVSAGTRSRSNTNAVKKVKTGAFFREQKLAELRKQEKQEKQQAVEARRCERLVAMQRHRKQKSHEHKLLAKRNYKGQPNLASRMELLLEKITRQQT